MGVRDRTRLVYHGLKCEDLARSRVLFGREEASGLAGCGRCEMGNDR